MIMDAWAANQNLRRLIRVFDPELAHIGWADMKLRIHQAITVWRPGGVSDQRHIWKQRLGRSLLTHDDEVVIMCAIANSPLWRPKGVALIVFARRQLLIAPI